MTKLINSWQNIRTQKEFESAITYLNNYYCDKYIKRSIPLLLRCKLLEEFNINAKYDITVSDLLDFEETYKLKIPKIVVEIKATIINQSTLTKTSLYRNKTIINLNTCLNLFKKQFGLQLYLLLKKLSFGLIDVCGDFVMDVYIENGEFYFIILDTSSKTKVEFLIYK